MSISNQITRLNNAKAAIKQALVNKGIEVSDAALLDEYPALIDSIETNGGSDEFLAMRTLNHTNYSYLFYNYTGNSLDANGIDKWDTSNVTTMGNMFNYCYNLATINGIDKWNTSKVTDMNRMFNYCHKLITLDLSNFDTSNVTNMNFMFNCCSNLETLDIRNFDMINVTNMSNMFSYCYELHTLRLDNCNNGTINKIITSSGFHTGTIDGVKRKIYVNPDNIEGLTPPTNWIFVDSDGNEIVPEPEEPEIYVPGYYQYNTEITEATTMVNSSHTDLSGMFEGCTNLTTINNIDQWDTSNVTNMWRMFSDCRNLERLDLSNFDMSKVDTSAEPLLMFFGCNNLRELRLDNCSNDTINKIINASLPFGEVEIDGERQKRKMYVNPNNIEGLTAPEGWIFINCETGEEIIPDEGGEEIPVCEYCGEPGCDGSCTYCPECGNLNEECTCTCPDCGELLRECICGSGEEIPVCEYCGEEGCDGSCQEGGEE